LRPITKGFVAANLEAGEVNPVEVKAQIEVLRKMLLAMVEDIRVVLLRLASRTQTLRFYAANPDDLRVQVARETLELYSPLANRLGVWELKWELEDLSFRFIHPDIYKKIAKHARREAQRARAVHRRCGGKSARELAASGVDKAEVYGRPKHIYSIWNKMRKKGVEFSEVYDVRALRIIVDDLKDCYTALGIVHNLWSPISKEFDDYISNPKGNNYRSLHTAVRCPDGRSLEIQIRTTEMHKHAELGVAAHWRYKEGSKRTSATLRREDRLAAPTADLEGRSRRSVPTGSATTSRPRSTRRSTSSRRRARWSICRAARRRSTSPTACIPTSATAAAAPRSTASWCRSIRRWKPGSRSRSLPPRSAGRRATG
jgi:GTP pyrophosphokinase